MNDRISKNTTKSTKRNTSKQQHQSLLFDIGSEFYQSEMQLKRQKNKEGKGKGTDEDTIQKYSNKINKTFL